jgi:hypothetical protein
MEKPRQGTKFFLFYGQMTEFAVAGEVLLRGGHERDARAGWWGNRSTNLQFYTKFNRRTAVEIEVSPHYCKTLVSGSCNF